MINAVLDKIAREERAEELSKGVAPSFSRWREKVSRTK